MTLDDDLGDLRVALNDVLRPDGRLVAESGTPRLLLREGRRRVRRRRVMTASGAVATVAAVGVIVGASALLSQSTSGSRPAPTLSKPAQPGLQGVVLGLDQSNRLVLEDLAHPAQKRFLTISGLEAFTTNPAGGWMAAYVSDGGKGPTYLGVINRSGTFSPTKQLLSTSDPVSNLAVSADGSRLAFVTGNVGTAAVTSIVVRPTPGHADSTRTWTLQDKYINEISNLSWAPDGRRLTYVAGTETGAGIAGNPITLDTGAPGVLVPTTSAYELGKCDAHAATWLGATGRFAIVRDDCSATTEPLGSQFVAVDPRTGAVLGRATTIPGVGCGSTSLSSDQDGSHVIVSECGGTSLVAEGHRFAVPGNLLSAAWAGTGLPNPGTVLGADGPSCPSAFFTLPAPDASSGLTATGTGTTYQDLASGGSVVVAAGIKGQRIELLRGVSAVDFAVSVYSHGNEPLQQDLTVLGSTAALYPASVTGDVGPRIPFATGNDLATNPCNRWELRASGLTAKQLIDYGQGVKSVTSPTATATCAPASLLVRLGPEGSATAHRGLVFLITNRLNTACQISGYPTLTLLDSVEKPVAVKAIRGSGYVYQDPGPRPVVLPAGGYASFGVTLGVDKSASCAAKSFMNVRLPDELNSFNVPLDVPPCLASAMNITAIVSGNAGPPS